MNYKTTAQTLPQKFYSPKKAAEKLNCSSRQVYRLIQGGAFGGATTITQSGRIRRTNRISDQALTDFLNRQSFQ